MDNGPLMVETQDLVLELQQEEANNEHGYD